MRTALTDTGTTSTRLTVPDLDYLAARLHGRRSRMAEGERLDGLSRIRSLPEFAQIVFPGSSLAKASDFQRESISELVRELSGFLVHLPASGARFLESVLARFQVENVKVLLRIIIARTYEGDLPHYIVPVPREAALNVRELAAAESLEDFVRLTPKGLIRDSLRKALEIYHGFSQPFFFEAALDQAYFQELIARVDELSEEDSEIIKPMACQEADIFHLMLTLRGKFNYGLTREMLLPLHVAGTRIPRALFAEMLGDSDLRAAVDRAVGRALDTALPEGGSGDEAAPQVMFGGVTERLAWKRFLRLANLAFRRSHMGLGAIAGYAGLRRMEVANLITVSEGIERGVDAETIRAHLIRGTEVEAVHV